MCVQTVEQLYSLAARAEKNEILQFKIIRLNFDLVSLNILLKEDCKILQIPAYFKIDIKCFRILLPYLYSLY